MAWRSISSPARPNPVGAPSDRPLRTRRGTCRSLCGRRVGVWLRGVCGDDRRARDREHDEEEEPAEGAPEQVSDGNNVDDIMSIKASSTVSSGYATRVSPMAAAGRTRRRQTREESRRQILAAADAILRERSYRDLTIDAVMERTGFSRTVFYRHFADLPDLVLAVMQDAGIPLLEQAEAMAAAP